MTLADLIEELDGANSPDDALDRKVWAALEKHDWPLPIWAENFYREEQNAFGAKRRAATCAATSADAAILLADDLLPGAVWVLNRGKETVSCTMSAEVEGCSAASDARREFPVGCEAMPIALATIECHMEIQKQLQARWASPTP